ncbi:MAG TPA: hypothetical protein VGJ06_09840 [Candidatus Acidoferrum sp.]
MSWSRKPISKNPHDEQYAMIGPPQWGHSLGVGVDVPSAGF